eukprot:TRINITY_DN30868_c0_g1_i1.p1 TRINITY_DN30868_c0_g1~~TRINITY_DN30868_c0_g1_i1.p1  ORF type:complete len:1153 (-),score=238.74 TRINITY_DN30868_c0_g1_i1:144-3602(-)
MVEPEERVSVEEEPDGIGSGGKDVEEVSVVEEEPYDEFAQQASGDSYIDDFASGDDLMHAIESQASEQIDVTQTGQEIVTDSFGELLLPREQVEQLQQCWDLLVTLTGSREALADLLYFTYFNASPSLEHLFVTPKAVLAFRLFTGVNTFITNANNAASLRMHVETTAYGHMYLDITVERVKMIRDAILDMLVTELGGKLTPDAATGCVSLWNYIGGAMIFVKATCHERMTTLLDSWKMANDKSRNEERMVTASKEAKEGVKGKNGSGSSNNNSSPSSGSPEAQKGEEHQSSRKKGQDNLQNIPTTFNEMFMFNAAVMGFGKNLWMSEVLAVFDNLVSNFAAVGRVQEECHTLTVRIAKVASGRVNLAEFKSCMLASLRSLLPKDWTSNHEVAWSWCWDKIESLLLENMGKTNAWERALQQFFETVDESTGYQMRQDFYANFFSASPAGEAYFKQNVTYLHLLVTKVLGLCMSMYKEPVQTVDELSGIGLRHVGYGIPTEIFQPYMTVMCEVIRNTGCSEQSFTAFRWSMNLVTQMMTRTILEGATIVMKAINANSPKAVKLAISCAARGVRAEWMLLIRVGTRDISPFLWSVQSGAIEAGLTMLNDLLTIRADRDKYYYEADYLFRRHHDLVNVFLQDAPTMLVPLFDGLIWRSRLTDNGHRRTNYYLRHLLIDPEGKFAKALEWIVKSRDPKLMVHPLLVLLSDNVWSGVAQRTFIQRKIWFIFTLVIFVVSQSVLKAFKDADDEDSSDDSAEGLRIATFVLRGFIYLFSMSHMLFMHNVNIRDAVLKRDFACLFTVGRCSFSVPRYLTNWQDAFNLLLTVLLILMLCTEPIIHCMENDGGVLFTEACPGITTVRTVYYIFNMSAMFLYYILLADLAVFHNRVSAYVLVCGRTLAEVCLFLGAIFLVLLMLGSAFSCLDQSISDFQTIQHGFLSMWDMLLGVFGSRKYDALTDEPVILLGVYVASVINVLFLLNLLIAQLCCAYGAIHGHMVGYARVKRSRIIVESMPMVSAKRWHAYKDSLGLDEPIEFNEGDIGIAGGIQVLEPASHHPTTVDTIKRVGGTTSPLVQWPEENDNNEEEDKFGRLEAMMKKIIDTVQAAAQKKKKAHNAKSSTVKSAASASNGSMIGSDGEQASDGDPTGSDERSEEEG